MERRLLEDHQVDRPDVQGQQWPQLTGTNSQPLGRFDLLLESKSGESVVRSQ
jgi:hypothetical protein